MARVSRNRFSSDARSSGFEVGLAADAVGAGCVGAAGTAAEAGAVGVAGTAAVAAGLAAGAAGGVVATPVWGVAGGTVGLGAVAAAVADPACGWAGAAVAVAGGAAGGAAGFTDLVAIGGEAVAAGGETGAVGDGTGSTGAGAAVVCGAGLGTVSSEAEGDGCGTASGAASAAGVPSVWGGRSVTPAQPAHARPISIPAIRNARVTRKFSRRRATNQPFERSRCPEVTPKSVPRPARECLPRQDQCRLPPSKTRSNMSISARSRHGF
jgi:hypothetical protein